MLQWTLGTCIFSSHGWLSLVLLHWRHWFLSSWLCVSCLLDRADTCVLRFGGCLQNACPLCKCRDVPVCVQALEGPNATLWLSPPHSRGSGWGLCNTGSLLSGLTLLILQFTSPWSLSCECIFRSSVVSDSVTPWTVAHQAPLSMGFSSKEHWSGLPFPPPGDLLNTGTEPRSPTLQTDPLLAEPPGKPKKEQGCF